MTVAARNDHVVGVTPAGETLEGTGADDTLVGLGGDDVLIGYAGADRLDGRDGDDLLLGGLGDDTVIGGAGADTIDGAGGDDLASGGDGDDLIYGRIGADTLVGDRGDDTLGGAEGNDRLDGRDGDDSLNGGVGNDTLLGGAGNDRLNGAGGNDLLRGGVGDDSIQGGAGADTLFGEAGDDTLGGGSGADKLAGGVGDDELSGGSAGGSDTLSGGDGDDTLLGGDGNDLARGDDGADHLLGGTGNDTLSGSGGNDRVDGERGDDQVSGNAGDDTLVGGKGDDTITGGTGTDTAVFSGDVGDYTVTRLRNGGFVVTDTNLKDGDDGTDVVRGDVEFLAFDDVVMPRFPERFGSLKFFGGSGQNLGAAVSAVGDLDGDGRNEIALGEPGQAFDTGRAYLIPSSALPALQDGNGEVSPGNVPGAARFTDSHPYPQTGAGLADLGDIDGDGLPELAIGAPGVDRLDPFAFSAGQTYVASGALLASQPTAVLNGLPPSDAVVIRGVDTFDRVGSSIGRLGDVDGDGTSELLIRPLKFVGDDEAYVVLGGSIRAAATHGGVIDLADLSGGDGVVLKFDSDQTGYLGVVAAGDIDGDGRGDVLLGGAQGDDSFTGRVEVTLVFGSEIAAAAAGSGVLDRPLGSGVTLIGDVGPVVQPPLAAAGDIDGDGRDDILVAAPYASPDGRTNAGLVTLVYGAAIDAMHPGTVDLATLGAGEAVAIAGANAQDQLGRVVAGIGDVDGDGIADIAMSAGPDMSHAYVLFGAALLAAADDGGVLDLATLTADQGVEIVGIPATYTGSKPNQLAGGGDADGDGLGDLLIGAPNADRDRGPSEVEGAAYLITGALIDHAREGNGMVDLDAIFV